MSKHSPSGTEAKRPARERTRLRIIEAAETVFSEQGIKGATTREIARVADVNETTLFRHFQSKDALLTAVVELSAARISEALHASEMTHNNLEEGLLDYATEYLKALKNCEPLIRVFIGEANRQPTESRVVLYNAWKPVKEILFNYLCKAKKAGQIREDIDPVQAGNMLTGSILSHVLSKQMTAHLYPSKSYLQTLVQIFAAGMAPNPQQKSH